MNPTRGRPSGRRLPIWAIAIVGAISLLVLVALLYGPFRLASDAITGHVRAQLKSTAAVAAEAVRSEMQGLADVVSSFAQRPSLQRALDDSAHSDAADVEFHLEELQRSRPGIATTFLADPTGRLIAIVPATPSIVGRDFSYRDWYRGVTALHAPYVSEAYESLAAGHPRVVASAVEVRSPGRGVVGILVAAYDLQTIDSFVDRFAESQGLALTVTDQRATLLAIPGDVQQGSLRSRRTDPIVRAALHGRSGVATRASEAGTHLVAYVPVPGLGWTVSASAPEAIVLSSVARLKAAIAIVAGILGLVFLTGALLLLITLRRRKRAEEERDRFFDISRDPLCVAGFDGYFKRLNPAWERMLGYSMEELARSPFLSFVHPDDRERTRLEAQKLVEGDETVAFENRYRCRDGSYRWFLWTAISFPEQELIYAAARDITQRKEAEAAIELAREDASRANAAKSEFLSRMSHELRTPLNAVLGFAQLLQMDRLTPDQQESVEQILKGGRHLLTLINEVLDIARIESGRMSLSLEPVGAAPAIQETLDLVAPLAAKRRLEIRGEFEGCDLYVFADRQRLKQLLLNLLSNAVNYNRDEGSITVSCSEAGTDRVQLSVADTGPGIPEDRLDRLFSPFDRLGAEQTSVVGTGLGLALSKALAEAMGGTIRIETELGKGSTFVLDLPMSSDPVTQVRGEDRAAQQSPVAEGPRRIVYVEDNFSNLKLVERILGQWPEIQLLPAMKGGLGLDLAREHQPHLILLDLNLPDMHGHDFLKQLRADPSTAHIPVAVISADATPNQVDRLKQAGARAYLTKPLDVAEFVAVVKEALAA